MHIHRHVFVTRHKGIASSCGGSYLEISLTGVSFVHALLRPAEYTLSEAKGCWRTVCIAALVYIYMLSLRLLKLFRLKSVSWLVFVAI